MVRRSIRKRRDPNVVLEQTPWWRFKNPYAPIEILNPNQLQKIHGNSMRILSDIGIKVLDPRS